jgi:hypothetical protein
MSLMIEDRSMTPGMATALSQMLGSVQMNARLEQAGNVIALHLALGRIASGQDVVTRVEQEKEEAETSQKGVIPE